MVFCLSCSVSPVAWYGVLGPLRVPLRPARRLPRGERGGERVVRGPSLGATWRKGEADVSRGTREAAREAAPPALGGTWGIYDGGAGSRAQALRGTGSGALGAATRAPVCGTAGAGVPLSVLHLGECVPPAVNGGERRWDAGVAGQTPQRRPRRAVVLLRRSGGLLRDPCRVLG